MNRFAAALLLLLTCAPCLAQAPAWQLDVFQTDSPGQLERRLAFTAPVAGQHQWRLCAVLPNVSDDYWDWVQAGIRREALRLNIRLHLFEASGYSKAGLRQQQRVLQQRCLENAVDAVLIAAIDDQGLHPQLKDLRARGVKVIDLINGYQDAWVDAHASTDFFHLGQFAGQLLAERLPDTGKPLRLLWVPGPDTATWARRGDQGFKAALGGNARFAVETLFIEPHYRVQSQAIQKRLARGDVYDVIVGTAPTAVAVESLKADGLLPRDLPVIAYYSTPEVARLQRDGRLLAAVTDNPEAQGRIGVALAYQLLEQQPAPWQVGPVPSQLTGELISLLKDPQAKVRSQNAAQGGP